MTWGNKLLLVFAAFALLIGTLVYKCMQQNFELVSKDYYNDELQLYKQKKLDAKATITVGEYPVNPKVDVQKTAALMKTVETIYNLEETITKT